MIPTFLAIDIETANSNADSACSIGLVLVRNGKINAYEHYYVCPPYETFHWRNVEVHQITWDDVHDAGTFRDVWREVKYLVRQAEFFVAHNASFDQRVLHGSMAAHDMRLPRQQFACTRQMSKLLWPHYASHSLAHVCRYQRIPIRQHHAALDDAWACANLALVGFDHGWKPFA